MKANKETSALSAIGIKRMKQRNYLNVDCNIHSVFVRECHASKTQSVIQILKGPEAKTGSTNVVREQAH